MHDRHGLWAQEARGVKCEAVCVRAGSLALGKGTVTQSEVLGLPKAQLICLVGCECERRRHLLQRRLVGAAPSSQEHDALKVGHQGALDGWNPLQLCLKVGRRAEPARHVEQPLRARAGSTSRVAMRDTMSRLHQARVHLCQHGASFRGAEQSSRVLRGTHAATMYHRGTFPSPPIAPPVPLSPLPAPLPLLWNLPPVLPPLTQLPPSAPPPNVGVDLFGVILLLVCVVNTLFTVIILYYTVRSLCHRRVKRPVLGGNYPPVSVLVPCYLPNEQVRTTRTPPAHCPHTPHRARLASEVRLPLDRVAGHHHGLHRNPTPNPNP